MRPNAKRNIQIKKAFLLLLLLIVAAILLACGGEQTEGETVVAAEAVVTPEPVIISIGVAEQQASVDAEKPPEFSPTPEPTPTPLPFSVYAPTINMTYEELVGSTDDMDKSGRELLKDGFPDPKTYYVIVDLQWQVTMVFKRIDDGTEFGKPDYDQPVRYMLCSTGNPDREYAHETTKGIFHIQVPKERFYQFVNLEAAQYLTLIRSRTYFHSVLYEKKGNLNTFVRSSYDDLGTKASHACIRLTVPDARWIWYNIGYGTTCEVRAGDPEDTFTASIRAQLKLPPSKDNVRLRASEYVWTDNWSIDELEHVLEYKYQEAPKPDMGEGDEEDLTPTPDPGTGGIIDGGAVSPDTGATQAPVQTEVPVTTEAPLPPSEPTWDPSSVVF